MADEHIFKCRWDGIDSLSVCAILFLSIVVDLFDFPITLLDISWSVTAGKDSEFIRKALAEPSCSAGRCQAALKNPSVRVRKESLSRESPAVQPGGAMRRPCRSVCVRNLSKVHIAQLGVAQVYERTDVPFSQA